MALPAGLVVLAVLMAHWPVLSARAVSFDDEPNLFMNPVLMNPSPSSAGHVLSEVTGSPYIEGYYIPLTAISLMVDVGLGGRQDNLRPFHRTNLALHAGNTALIVVFLYLLFGRPWVAALAGLLWGVHPLTVEPVAWVFERKTVLATFFALWSLVLYVRWVQRSGGSRYAASVACCLLALLSKPTVLPLPLLLFLLDWWPLNRLSRRSVVEKIPFLALAALAGGVTLTSHARNVGLAMPGHGVPLLQWPLRVGYLLMFYAGKIVWPVHLSSIYELPRPMAASNGWVIAGMVFSIALIGLLAWALRAHPGGNSPKSGPTPIRGYAPTFGAAAERRAPAVVVGVAFFVSALAPTLGFIGYSWVAASDKYLYLPMVGLLLPLVWLLCRSFDRLRSRTGSPRGEVVIVAGVLGLSLLAARATRGQIAHWSDTEGYYRYMATLSPEAAYAHSALGLTLVQAGKKVEGIEHLEKAIRLDPRCYNALFNLGTTLVDEGRHAQAAGYLRRAIPGMPRNFAVRFNLGLALTQMERLDEAVAQFHEALAIRPDLSAKVNLGIILLQKGDVEEASAVLEEIVREAPDYALAHHTLARAAVAAGKDDEAISHFRRAVELVPDRAEWRLHLGEALARAGQVNEAIEQFRRGLEIEPTSPMAINNLAWHLAVHDGVPAGAGEESIELAERVNRITGEKKAVILDTLAAAYAAGGRFPQAVETARRAMALAIEADAADFAAKVGERLKLYEAGRPYREGTGSRPGP